MTIRDGILVGVLSLLVLLVAFLIATAPRSEADGAGKTNGIEPISQAQSPKSPAIGADVFPKFPSLERATRFEYDPQSRVVRTYFSGGASAEPHLNCPAEDDQAVPDGKRK